MRKFNVKKLWFILLDSFVGNYADRYRRSYICHSSVRLPSLSKQALELCKVCRSVDQLRKAAQAKGISHFRQPSLKQRHFILHSRSRHHNLALRSEKPWIEPFKGVLLAHVLNSSTFSNSRRLSSVAPDKLRILIRDQLWEPRLPAIHVDLGGFAVHVRAYFLIKVLQEDFCSIW